MNWFRRHAIHFMLAKALVIGTVSAGSFYLIHKKEIAIQEWRKAHPCVHFTPGGWCEYDGLYGR